MKPEKSQKPKQPRPQAGKTDSVRPDHCPQCGVARPKSTGSYCPGCGESFDRPSGLAAPKTEVSEGIEGMLLWADTLNKLTDTGASPFTEVK